MIKYVELVQRPERNEQVDILTHQKWSGANLMDKQVTSGGVVWFKLTTSIATTPSHHRK